MWQLKTLRLRFKQGLKPPGTNQSLSFPPDNTQHKANALEHNPDYTPVSEYVLLLHFHFSFTRPDPSPLVTLVALFISIFFSLCKLNVKSREAIIYGFFGSGSSGNIMQMRRRNNIFLLQSLCIFILFGQFLC